LGTADLYCILTADTCTRGTPSHTVTPKKKKEGKKTAETHTKLCARAVYNSGSGYRYSLDGRTGVSLERAALLNQPTPSSRNSGRPCGVCERIIHSGPLGGRNLYLRVQRPIFNTSIIASKPRQPWFRPTISAASSAGNNASRASVQDVIDSFHFLFITSKHETLKQSITSRFIVIPNVTESTENIQRCFMQNRGNEYLLTEKCQWTSIIFQL